MSEDRVQATVIGWQLTGFPVDVDHPGFGHLRNLLPHPIKPHQATPTANEDSNGQPFGSGTPCSRETMRRYPCQQAAASFPLPRPQDLRAGRAIRPIPKSIAGDDGGGRWLYLGGKWLAHFGAKTNDVWFALCALQNPLHNKGRCNEISDRKPLHRQKPGVLLNPDQTAGVRGP